MLVHPSSMTVSIRHLNLLAQALRKHREQIGTRWRLLSSREQALMVLTHLREGETYRDLAGGFRVGVTTAYRYLREGLQVLAAMGPHPAGRDPHRTDEGLRPSTARCCGSTGSRWHRATTGPTSAGNTRATA